MTDRYKSGILRCLGVLVILTTTGVAWPASDSCTVAVSVVRATGPSIPWPPSAGVGKFLPPLIMASAPELPPEGFVAYDKRGREFYRVGIMSVERKSGPRRIVMVIGGVGLRTDNGQPMLQAIPVAIDQILATAGPQDSFALLTVGGPRAALRLGSGRDAIRTTVDQFRNAKWERGGKGVLDALAEATSWFGPPQMGDSIILFGGLPHEAGARMSQLSASLRSANIRLLVFSGSALSTTGGDLTSGTWVRPLAWVCAGTGGAWQRVGYAGAKSADENVWLWQTEAEGLYEIIRSVYVVSLERTGPNIGIDLSPQFRQQMARGLVIYPNPLPVCP